MPVSGFASLICCIAMNYGSLQNRLAYRTPLATCLCSDKPMLVLYGDSTPELETIKTKKPQVTAVKVQMSSPFGTHHT